MCTKSESTSSSESLILENRLDILKWSLCHCVYFRKKITHNCFSFCSLVHKMPPKTTIKRGRGAASKNKASSNPEEPEPVEPVKDLATEQVESPYFAAWNLFHLGELVCTICLNISNWLIIDCIVSGYLFRTGHNLVCSSQRDCVWSGAEQTPHHGWVATAMPPHGDGDLWWKSAFWGYEAHIRGSFFFFFGQTLSCSQKLYNLIIGTTRLSNFLTIMIIFLLPHDKKIYSKGLRVWPAPH